MGMEAPEWGDVGGGLHRRHCERQGKRIVEAVMSVSSQSTEQRWQPFGGAMNQVDDHLLDCLLISPKTRECAEGTCLKRRFQSPLENPPALDGDDSV